MLTSSTTAVILVLAAIVFALAYGRIVSHLSRGLVSPYGKADVMKRLLAAVIDAGFVLGAALLYLGSPSFGYLLLASSYLLFRDSVKGQSLGKLTVGLVVIDLQRARPASVAASVKRNALLLIPGANVVAVFLEARTLVRDPQGQRLGDRLAQTQVVEGFGAKDLVKSFQEWLMGIGAEFGAKAGRRGRVPVRSDRAAYGGSPRESR